MQASEPDAAWWVRDGDHRHDPDQPGRRNKVAFGWDAHILTMTVGEDEPGQYPLLILGLTFDKPGFNPVGHGRKLFTSVHERGWPAGFATADRVYMPNGDPEGLQIPLLDMGYQLAFDLRERQLGVTAEYEGAVQVDGTWYCPGMPSALVSASIDFFEKKTIDEATFYQRLAKRNDYLLRRKERPDAKGTVPRMCPAIGPGAPCSCSLRQNSTTSVSMGRTRIHIVPHTPGKICTNASSLSIPRHVGAKYGQAYPFFSDEWKRVYSAGRNTIEGTNAYGKDGNREQLGEPSRRRVRGRAAQHLLVTVLLVAANIRKLRTWLAERAAEEHGALARLDDRRAAAIVTSSATSAGARPAAIGPPRTA